MSTTSALIPIAAVAVSYGVFIFARKEVKSVFKSVHTQLDAMEAKVNARLDAVEARLDAVGA